MSKVIKEKIEVIGHDITIKNINGVEYISLTDLARYVNGKEPSLVIFNWMCNKNSFEFYSLWEELNNDNFNSMELKMKLVLIDLLCHLDVGISSLMQLESYLQWVNIVMELLLTLILH